MPLFTRQQHVNTLAPLRLGELWAVLHNMGKVSGLGEGMGEGRGQGCVGEVSGLGSAKHGRGERTGRSERGTVRIRPTPSPRLTPLRPHHSPSCFALVERHCAH